MDEINNDIEILRNKINDIVRPVTSAYVLHKVNVKTAYSTEDLLLAQNAVIKSLQQILELELVHKLASHEKFNEIVKVANYYIDENKRAEFNSSLYGKPKDSSFSSN